MTSFHIGVLEILALATVGGRAGKSVDRAGAGTRIKCQMIPLVFSDTFALYAVLETHQLLTLLTGLVFEHSMFVYEDGCLQG